MKSAYKVLAYLIAIEVAIQAAVMVFAIAGLGIWVAEEGGVLDQSSFLSEEPLFPEMIGFFVHGLNGMYVIPLLALILLIVSFFAKVPRGTAWAGAILGLVVLQVALGIGGHMIAVSGLLHGLNALVLFTTALLAARRVTTAAPAEMVSRSPERAMS